MEKGFTLIELMLVAIIVGLFALAALLGLKPLEQVRKAQDAGKISQGKEVISAAEAYYVFHQNDPACGDLGLKPGSCDDITLIGSDGVYQVTFEPASKVYQDICGGLTCTLPDDLL